MVTCTNFGISSFLLFSPVSAVIFRFFLTFRFLLIVFMHIRYTVDGLHDEVYTITAKKDHFAFNTASIRLTAKKAEIPDIVAER